METMMEVKHTSKDTCCSLLKKRIWEFQWLSLAALAFMIAGLTQLRCFDFWWCYVPFVITALLTVPLILSPCQVACSCLPTTLRRFMEIDQLRYYMDAVYLSFLVIIHSGYVCCVELLNKFLPTWVWGDSGGYYFFAAEYLMLCQAVVCVYMGKRAGKRQMDGMDGAPEMHGVIPQV